jgi:hypothetical protein
LFLPATRDQAVSDGIASNAVTFRSSICLAGGPKVRPDLFTSFSDSFHKPFTHPIQDALKLVSGF